MKNDKLTGGRKRRTLYVAIDPRIQLAARQQALAEGKTLSVFVEEALRAKVDLASGGGSDVG